MLNLLAKAYGFAGAANVGVVAPNPLPAPQATLISALAQGVIGGNLDWKMLGIGALVGVGLILLDATLGAMNKLRIPPLAVGIGIYLPMSATFAVVVGAVVSHWYDGRVRSDAESRARRATGDARRVGADRRRESVGRAQRRSHRRVLEGRADRPRARGLRARAVAWAARLRWLDRVAVWLDAAEIQNGMRFLVSFLFGLLAEVATGLVIGVGMGITRGGAMPSNPADFPSWVPIVAIVAGSLFTFLVGLWRASRQPDRHLGHGLSVAAGAIALHLATALGGGRPLTVLYVVADVLKLVAGVAAGVAAQRRAGASA